MRTWIHLILPATSLLSLIAVRLRRPQRQLLRDLEAGRLSAAARVGQAGFSGKTGTQNL